MKGYPPLLKQSITPEAPIKQARFTIFVMRFIHALLKCLTSIPVTRLYHICYVIIAVSLILFQYSFNRRIGKGMKHRNPLKELYVTQMRQDIIDGNLPHFPFTEYRRSLVSKLDSDVNTHTNNNMNNNMNDQNNQSNMINYESDNNKLSVSILMCAGNRQAKAAGVQAMRLHELYGENGDSHPKYNVSITVCHVSEMESNNQQALEKLNVKTIDLSNIIIERNQSLSDFRGYYCKPLCMHTVREKNNNNNNDNNQQSDQPSDQSSSLVVDFAVLIDVDLFIISDDPLSILTHTNSTLPRTGQFFFRDALEKGTSVYRAAKLTMQRFLALEDRRVSSDYTPTSSAYSSSYSSSSSHSSMFSRFMRSRPNLFGLNPRLLRRMVRLRLMMRAMKVHISNYYCESAMVFINPGMLPRYLDILAELVLNPQLRNEYKDRVHGDKELFFWAYLLAYDSVPSFSQFGLRPVLSDISGTKDRSTGHSFIQWHPFEDNPQVLYFNGDSVESFMNGDESVIKQLKYVGRRRNGVSGGFHIHGFRDSFYISDPRYGISFTIDRYRRLRSLANSLFLNDTHP